MYDLARIRYVTEHYRDMQGLALVPLSLFFMGWAAYDAGWFRPPGWLGIELVLGLISLTAALVLTWVIEKLYERTFGQITPDPSRESEPKGIGFWIWFAAYTSINALTVARDDISYLGVMIFMFTVLFSWRLRARKHWLILAAAIAFMTLIPLLDDVVGPVYSSATTRDITIKLVFATGILVIGTVEHLTLVRTLRPMPQEEESRG